MGWSIGNGWHALLCPVMFNEIGAKTLYIFGVSSIITLPMVWALYPKSNQRTLKEMNLLFAADMPWVWDAEKNLAKLTEQHPELVGLTAALVFLGLLQSLHASTHPECRAAAKRGNSIVDPKSGVGDTRRMGIVARVASLEVRQEGAPKN